MRRARGGSRGFRGAALGMAVMALMAAGAVFPAGAAATPLASGQGARYVTGDNRTTGGHIAIEGDRLYMGSYGKGMRIYDISDPAAPKLIGTYEPGLRADAVPDAAVFDGRHIAVLNGTRRVTAHDSIRTDRSEFLDVTDPAHPVLLHTLLGQTDGEAHNGDIVDERRLWLPSGGSGTDEQGRGRGLRIYDLTPVLGSPPAAPEKLFSGDPVALWEASPYRGGRPVGAAFTHTHDVSVYPDHPVQGLGPRDIALLAEGGNYLGSGNTGSVFVIDITDPGNPVVLLRWLHQTGDDHHPIRYHHEAQLLDGDRKVMLVTDEDLHNGCGHAGGVTAVRLTDDLTSAVELSEWFIPSGTPAPICSVHVFSSHGNLVFIGSYNAGLQVLDYSDPAAPQRVAHFIADGSTAWGAYYHQGFVYMGDMSRGLDVLEYTGPRPDLTLDSDDISLSEAGRRGRVVVTAAVHNAGGVGATNLVVRFLDNGVPIGADRVIERIPAGETGQASVVWDTQGLRGLHTIRVVVDPEATLDEADEGNNAARMAVRFRRGQS